MILTNINNLSFSNAYNINLQRLFHLSSAYVQQTKTPSLGGRFW